MTSRPRLLFAMPLISALIAMGAACDGGDGGSTGSGTPTPALHTPITAAYYPVTVSSDLAVGQNRFVAGLLTQDNMPVARADLAFAFYSPTGGEETPAFETKATAVTVTQEVTVERPDGSTEVVEGQEVGVYVANVEFSEAGEWHVDVGGSLEDGTPIETVRTLFTVREQSLSPAIGAPAPRSVQATLADVSDIKDIDTSSQPNPAMHDMTIADAVTSGRPTVIAFATPAFCTSQICGPTKDYVDDLFDAYGDQANFVHVEPYDVPRARAGQCAPDFSDCIIPLVTSEWGLRTEPWVFIVDAQGNIAAKFDGIVSYEELESALKATLQA